MFTQWDGRWYVEIVRSGYPRSIPPDITFLQDEARAAFFPLYPALVRVVDFVLPGGDTIAALGVNVVLGVVGMILVGHLARRLYDNDVAERAMVLFAVFPGSFVLSYAYAEALLIVLAALCLWFLMDERWLLAGVAAALATATRPNGIALCAACAVAAFIAIKRRREWWSLVAPLLSPIGFVAFQLFLNAHADERWPWFRVQREAWREGTSFGATALSNTFSFFTHPLASPTDALTAASMAALLLGLWCLYRKPLPWPMIAYIAVIVALMLRAGDRDGTAAVPVHRVPAVHQRRRVVAAPRPCRLGPHARDVRRRAGRAHRAVRASTARSPERVGGSAGPRRVAPGDEVAHAPAGDEQHRLGDDPARHLGLAEAAVAEHDRRLHHPAPGTHQAADELGQERVALGRRGLRGDPRAARWRGRRGTRTCSRGPAGRARATCSGCPSARAGGGAAASRRWPRPGT